MDLEEQFPCLSSDNYCRTSPKDSYYNCVAHAMDCNFAYWWPINQTPYYWPIEPRRNSVEEFEKAFRACGFEPTVDQTFETGYIKLAIYAYTENGLPSHVARLDNASGRWKSKCGDKEDIEHELQALIGPKPAYGRIELIMKCATSEIRFCNC